MGKIALTQYTMCRLLLLAAVLLLTLMATANATQSSSMKGRQNTGMSEGHHWVSGETRRSRYAGSRNNRNNIHMTPLLGTPGGQPLIHSLPSLRGGNIQHQQRFNTRTIPKFYTGVNSASGYSMNNRNINSQFNNHNSRGFSNSVASLSSSLTSPSGPNSLRGSSVGSRDSSSRDSSSNNNKGGAGLSRLDAMLGRLESNNDQLLVELQQQRDSVAAHRHKGHRRHHSSNGAHHSSDKSPYNFVSANSVLTSNNNITRNEAPEQVRQQIPLPPNRDTHASTRSSPGTSLRAGYNNDGNLNSVVRDDSVMFATDDADATVVEEADYQDEQASGRSRGNNAQQQQQHHLRERDAQSLRLASENVRYVMANAQCSKPVRRCIDLSNNQTSKKYWPRCAIVNRCSADSGCCYSPNHVCTVSEHNNIDLYFFYMTIEANSRAGVDRLEFENHTKCECKLRSLVAAAAAAAISDLSNDQPDDQNMNTYYNYNTADRNHHRMSNNNYNNAANRNRHVTTSNNYNNAETGNFGTSNNNYNNAARRNHHVTTKNNYNNADGSNFGTSNSNVNTNSKARTAALTSDTNAVEQKTKTTRQRQNSRSNTRLAAATITGVKSSNTPDGLSAKSVNTENERCKCPDVYEASTAADGSCLCTCDQKTGHCRRLMKGKRYFKSKDEKCIQSGECQLPSCKFGPFLFENKRCPRKREAKRFKNRA